MAPRSRRRRSRARITVLADAAELLELFTEILVAAGYDVDGRPAVESVGELVAATPDLLILDLGMNSADRGLSTYDLIARVRRRAELASIPIVLSTTNVILARNHAERLAGEFGLHVLRKPFEVAELETLTADLLKRPGMTARGVESALPPADELDDSAAY